MKPDRVEDLRAKRGSYTVKFLEITRIAASHPTAIICVFEGEDAKYYGPRIDMLRVGLEWFPINAGGRRVVLKVHELVLQNKNYADARVYFFVDLDYDERAELPTHPRLYITPGYSVENFYVSEQTILSFLKSDLTLLSEGNPAGIIEIFRALYIERLNEFLDCCDYVNSWLFLQRQAEKAEEKKEVPAFAKINASNIKLSQLLYISLQKVSGSYTQAQLRELTGCGRTLDESMIVSQIEKFRKMDRVTRFRGKFLAEFTRKFIVEMHLEAKKEPCFCGHILKLKTSPSSDNFLADMAQFAVTPDCVRGFVATL